MATRDEKKYYTILFVPGGSEKTVSLHVYRHIVSSFILFVIVFFIGFTCLVIKSGEIASKLHRVSALNNENRKLKAENLKLEYVKEKLDTIEAWGEYLQRIAVTTDVDKDIPVTAASYNDSSAPLNEEDVSLRSSIVDVKPFDFYNYSMRSKTIFDTLFDAIPTIQPTNGWITRGFYRDTSGHQGVDFAATSGTPIQATARGIVVSVVNDKILGLLITLSHGSEYSTRYGHCQTILVKQGDIVAKGQIIALVGSTGLSTAPHLHYEIRKDGTQVNPMDYISNVQ
jgi:murein DD-endopeptidase MepM/ murein hydrolase activator NlpD